MILMLTIDTPVDDIGEIGRLAAEGGNGGGGMSEIRVRGVASETFILDLGTGI
jgi:hypothetical protein